LFEYGNWFTYKTSFSKEPLEFGGLSPRCGFDGYDQRGFSESQGVCPQFYVPGSL